MIGDAHVYRTHVDGLREQLKRKCHPFPRISFDDSAADDDELKSIDDYRSRHIKLDNYQCHDEIKLPMAL